ncbi:class I SAM-dependent methyltransferase [Leptospira santarosai]|uniref:Methyltransferase n=1 Tax=Leptospira santarosai TaxID=28183 RepID=A0AB73M9Z7_9LEPT|nr:class I SAM-dependent methyltransferase [Leptospira santarosai]EMO84924.1 methyltransferase domain protein [Leptospira santarosai str. AIM]ONF91995.1 methyltransferase [Leptospira santarosai]
METEIIQSITNELLERYSKRFQRLGKDIKTLGWGTVEQQRYRFLQSINLVKDWEGKSVIDIGCGFGDFAKFLIELKIPFRSYLGVDINGDLLDEAKKMNVSPNMSFQKLNILSDPIDAIRDADIAVMFGVLNLNLKNKMDNFEYSKLFISKVFEIVRESLIFDFISTETVESYPKEDFIYYHDPVELLKYTLSLSSNVSLKHDYLPIPQKEGMIILSKDSLHS